MPHRMDKYKYIRLKLLIVPQSYPQDSSGTGTDVRDHDDLLQGDLLPHPEATESEDSSPTPEDARVDLGNDQGPPETQISGVDSEDHIDEDPGQLSPVTNPSTHQV